MLCRDAFSLECSRSDGVDTLREVQIACSVDLAWLRRNTTFVGLRARSTAWGIGIIFVRVDFEVSQVVMITPVSVELAAVSLAHSVFFCPAFSHSKGPKRACCIKYQCLAQIAAQWYW